MSKLGNLLVITSNFCNLLVITNKFGNLLVITSKFGNFLVIMRKQTKSLVITILQKILNNSRCDTKVTDQSKQDEHTTEKEPRVSHESDGTTNLLQCTTLQYVSVCFQSSHLNLHAKCTHTTKNSSFLKGLNEWQLFDKKPTRTPAPIPSPDLIQWLVVNIPRNDYREGAILHPYRHPTPVYGYGNTTILNHVRLNIFKSHVNGSINFFM